MSFWRSVYKNKVFVVATVYAILALLLYQIVDHTTPPNASRFLITVLLVYGVPVAVLTAWVLTGPYVRWRIRVASILVLAVSGVLWVMNTTRFSAGDEEAYFIAHRGLAQVMNPEHDSPFECLGRIHPPEHTNIENTLPSIGAAFDHGARIVEIDIRPTADEDFAVFHDHNLDCKTEVQGLVIDHTMDQLRSLDVGYGYFTIEGEHPLRGKGVGMMKSLNEVLDAFPAREFIIDVKFGGNRTLWSRLIEYLAARPIEDQRRIAVYGVPSGATMLRQALPPVTVGSFDRAFRCARSYVIFGWTGYVPASCRRSLTGTDVEMGSMFWGWPGRFIDRMHSVGAVVIMRPRGQTEQEFAAAIPPSYSGGIQTDRIDRFRDWMALGESE